MSERLPYELQLQQQWIDLPLPDENMAWADMRRRLEEDDDRPVIAWWRRGCVLWGTLLLLLVAIGWWWFRPEQWFISEATQQQTPNTTTDNKDNTGDNERSITPANTNELTQQPKSNAPLPGTNTTNTDSDVNNRMPGKRDNDNPGNNSSLTSNSTKNNTVPGRNSITSAGGRKTNSRTATTNASSSITTRGGAKSGRNQPPVSNNPQSPASPVINAPVASADTISNTVNQNKPSTDSSVAKTDSVKKKDTITNKPPVASTPKTDSLKKKKIFFSAGIAEHQQIPLGGQKFTPYSSSGRKSSLADYIPSVYFRVNKENKWFIQGEFRYGAPQYTKEFLYKDQTKSDTFFQVPYDVNTKATLKKTFYHQLPVTFNYYIMPNWSIGAGFAWNKFSSAVSDQEIIGTNSNTLQDTTLATGILSVKKDSSFSNSYFQGVLETHYKWKRFSFGARYMFGLQPYIKFRLAGGAQQQEKNSSLQLFIRYELWRSKRR